MKKIKKVTDFPQRYPFWTGFMMGLVMILFIFMLYIANFPRLAQWTLYVFATLIFVAWWHSPDPREYKPKTFDSYRGVWIDSTTDEEIWRRDASLGILFSLIPAIGIIGLCQKFFL